MNGVKASQRLRLASRAPSKRGDMLIPAQSQEHARLNDVLLQLRPSLPDLRRRCLPLFGRVTGTTTQSDFSSTCTSAVWFMAFADRPSHTLEGVLEISRFSVE